MATDLTPAGPGAPTAGGTQVPETEPPVEAARQETRRTVREARRRRRRLLAACGLVVALCLALTILVVSMA
ncbi:MAG TPA: hypothetical protein VKW77_03865, partial [Acidimicrobiales bacterium]|nr:hypothetical protein [Acidimicrobiales bacterium]